MDNLNQKSMTIGALAKAAGVGVETVRFYQRKALIHEPKVISGFRKYSDSDVQRIRFIKRAQELGFSLAGVQDLLHLAVCSQETRPLLVRTCEEKVAEIEQKISDLHKMLTMLNNFVHSCGSSNKSECELLSCFQNDGQCCQDNEREANGRIM